MSAQSVHPRRLYRLLTKPLRRRRSEARRSAPTHLGSRVRAQLAPGLVDLAAAAGQPPADALRALQSTSHGLTAAEAATRLATFGRNVLAERRVTAFGVLARQVRNPLLILLLGGAAVSGLTGDPIDAIIISLIVLLSVGLGFVNEYRSEQAASALHANIRHEAVVWRDGSRRRLDVSQLVPGDVVEIGAGDVVPADLRLLDSTQLECDEGVLTGESIPVEKTPTATSNRAKSLFYRAALHPRGQRPTHPERHQHRVARRAARFVRHTSHAPRHDPWVH